MSSALDRCPTAGSPHIGERPDHVGRPAPAKPPHAIGPPPRAGTGRGRAPAEAQPLRESPVASPITTGATPTARKAGRKQSPTGAVISTPAR